MLASVLLPSSSSAAPAQSLPRNISVLMVPKKPEFEFEFPPFLLTVANPLTMRWRTEWLGTGMASSPRKYTAGFKQRAVQLWRESGTSYAEVARGLGIDESSPRAWARKAGESGGGAGAPGRNPFRLEEGLRRPGRENAQLGRDNEILLKASAFLAGGNLWAPRRRGRGSRSRRPTSTSTRRARCAACRASAGRATTGGGGGPRCVPSSRFEPAASLFSEPLRHDS